MEMILNIASGALLAAGRCLVLVGTIGMLRLPDFFTRLHAAGITDTLGAELMLIGMMLQAGFSLITVKLILISLFIFFTSPTATHAVANAGRTMGLKPAMVPDEDIEATLMRRGSAK